MENSLLKYIVISSKRIKKHLLITHKEVSILHSFIENVTNGEVLIINTNFGVEIYYLSSIDYGALIKNSFLLMTYNKKTSLDEYRIHMYNSKNEIKEEIQKSLLKLSAMPLSFTYYSKNLFNQLKMFHKNNQQIISELFSIIEDVLASIYINKLNNSKIKQFIEDLEVLSINVTHNSILKLQLIKGATNTLRSN